MFALLSPRLGRMLVAGTAVCAFLVGLRVWWSGTPWLEFLLWNLFLAWVPLFIIYCWKKWQKKHPLTDFCFLAVWLLFFPNAPYITTDIFHFYYRDPIPLWYDLILMMSSVWLGLVLGYVSLYEVHEWLRVKFSKAKARIGVMGILTLSGFGMYIGRYLRWNSWDIMSNPLGLGQDILERVIHPFSHIRTWGATAGFTVFLLMSYGIFCAIVESGRSTRNT